jgi:hypothetical protein
VDAAKMYREDRAKFNDVARKSVRKSLGVWFQKNIKVYWRRYIYILKDYFWIVAICLL